MFLRKIRIVFLPGYIHNLIPLNSICCFIFTIVAAVGHYTYQIEFAGHTIFVKLAFKYLMRQAKGNAQRIAGSKIFECLFFCFIFFFGVLAKREK